MRFILDEIKSKVSYLQKKYHIFSFGKILSVVSLILSIVFFSLAYRYTSLRYITKTDYEPLLSKDIYKVKDIKVEHEGKLISDCISMYKISIWNAGNTPIKKRNILQNELKIILKPSCGIVYFNTKEHGVYLNTKIDEREANKGILYTSWDILRPGDGYSLEVLFFHDPKVNEFSCEVKGALDTRNSIIKGRWPLYSYYKSLILCILALLLTISGIYRTIKTLYAVRKNHKKTFDSLSNAETDIPPEHRPKLPIILKNLKPNNFKSYQRHIILILFGVVVALFAIATKPLSPPF